MAKSKKKQAPKKSGKKPRGRKGSAKRAPAGGKKIAIDSARYSRAPVLDSRRAIALARSLQTAMPKDATKGMKTAARRLEAAAARLEEAWDESSRAPTPSESRDADIAIDGAWGRLHDRLESFADLSPARHPRAREAKKIFDELFGAGLRFLTLPYSQEWAESQRRLKRIDGNKQLAADIDKFAGSEFLADVRLDHERYGEAIGITETFEEESSAPGVVDARRAVEHAIQLYAIQVLATADEEDPRTVKAALAALMPIDKAREKAARASTGRPARAPIPGTPGSPTP
ncbi:MAG: hypothetical protein HY720_10650 [Planctomycetes bacterium]|nr:hypothetical protein [Planctomycetota bacterium]